MRHYTITTFGVLAVVTTVIVWISDSKLSANAQRSIYDYPQVSEAERLEEFKKKSLKLFLDDNSVDDSSVEVDSALKVKSSELAQSLRQLAKAEECWIDANCQIELEKNSPLSAIETLRNRSFKALDKIKGHIFNNPKDIEKYEFVFSRYAKHEDDYLKESAFEFYYWVKPTQARFQVLMSGLSQSSSVPLFQSVVPLLVTYQDFGMGREVSQFVSHQIQYGGFFTARYLAKDSLRYMSPETIDIYQSTLDRLPLGLKRRKYLQLAIKEYHRNQNFSGASAQ